MKRLAGILLLRLPLTGCFSLGAHIQKGGGLMNFTKGRQNRLKPDRGFFCPGWTRHFRQYWIPPYCLLMLFARLEKANHSYQG